MPSFKRGQCILVVSYKDPSADVFLLIVIKEKAFELFFFRNRMIMWAQGRMDFLTANYSTGYLIRSLFNNKIWCVSKTITLSHTFVYAVRIYSAQLIDIH